jgi:catechol 2,3-dioxygenase-like lactoylglutathione lyase family enzyme
MARIRYLSILSRDPARLASFYTDHLGLRRLGESPDGDVTLSDGGYNLTLFKHRDALREPRMETGLHHLGIAVDSLAETEARYRRRYPRGTVVRESGDLQHGELRLYDPECNPVTVSERDFGLSGEQPSYPRIAHIALNALDPEALRDFYVEVFAFRDLMVAHADMAKRPGYRNRHVGDGFTNVAIQAFYNDREGFEPRFGIAHMGFLVKDMDGLMARMVGTAALVARPAGRVQSEVRMRDPDGNGCDLSRRGWEVDRDKWARADVA